jgi:amidase
LKQTYGRVSRYGVTTLAWTLDHAGPMTRTVADAALMLRVLAGPDGLDPRQPTVIEPVDYVEALAEPVTGLRVGLLVEGFGQPNSDPGVDASVRAATEVLRAEGLKVEEVSIPWHLDAMHVWNVIATEGAAYQMIAGNGYGLNYKGRYDPELMAHYHRRRLERGAELSKTVKLVAMSGRYTFEVGGGSYYAMAQNLAPEIRAAYDAAFAEFDVLVMPTLPYTAREIPDPNCDLSTYLDTALSMLANTAPFDTTGHPVCSVPVDLVDGLPAGMSIVGRNFDDATVLRVAHAYEQARGGFPAPPALTGMGVTS